MNSIRLRRSGMLAMFLIELKNGLLSSAIVSNRSADAEKTI
jgi:hypothetical protein